MYDKHTRSERWKKLLKKSKSMVKVAKKKFSENLITNLKYTDPSSQNQSLKEFTPHNGRLSMSPLTQMFYPLLPMEI